MRANALRRTSRGRDGGFAAVACMLLIAAAAAGPAHAQMQPSVRQGWLVGLGVGGGSSAISDAGLTSDRESGFAGHVRAGYAFNSQLSLELNGTGWTKEQSGTRVIFSVWGPALNYYPGQGGLVLRGGVGAGTGEALEEVGNVTISTSETGLGVMGGVGYEFRVRRRFALGPQFHASWMDLDSFNANWFSFELGFHWYFVPK